MSALDGECEELWEAIEDKYAAQVTTLSYRGTSLIRNTHPPKTTRCPYLKGYCRVLRGGVSDERGTPVVLALQVMNIDCRGANVAQIRQSRPDSSPGFQVEALKTL